MTKPYTTKICREITLSVPEHQTVISFLDDISSEMFESWWDMVGEKLFLEFKNTHLNDYL